MSNLCVVGITGYKGSGKSVVGEFLEQNGFRASALADPMKEACKTIFLWSDEDVYGDRKERIDPVWGISPRQALQHLGTEWGQIALPEAYENFLEVTGRKLWIKRFMITVQSHPEVDRWVVPDVRFPHEAEEIKGILGCGLILRVNRPGITRDDPHESETYYDSIEANYEIMNEGTIAELKEKVYRFVRLCVSG